MLNFQLYLHKYTTYITTTSTSGDATCEGLPATIVGTDGNDNLDGTEGYDVIVGFGGDDRIEGFGGHDTICGDEGNDNIDGGEATVTL